MFDVSHHWPQPLSTIKAWPRLGMSSGRAFLFTLIEGGGDWDDAAIVVQALDGGHLIHARGGSLLALPFDVNRLVATVAAVSFDEDVAQAVGGTTGAAQFSVSDDGTLVYVPASSAGLNPLARFLWVDSHGSRDAHRRYSLAYTSRQRFRQMAGASLIRRLKEPTSTSGSTSSDAASPSG